MFKEKLDKSFHYAPVIILWSCMFNLVRYPVFVSLQAFSKDFDPAPLNLLPFMFLAFGIANVYLFYKKNVKFLVTAFIFSCLYAPFVIYFFSRYTDAMNSSQADSLAIREISKAVTYSVFLILIVLKSKKVRDYFLSR